MKLSFSFKKKEANFEADVEKLIDKGMEQKAKLPPRKTRYQIKQEEKRKNAELKHKQEMQRFIIGISVLVGFMVIVFIICAVGSAMNW
jgi:hypothetical protein